MGLRFKQTYLTLNLPNPHPAGQGLTNLMVNIKDLLILRHQISSRNLPKTTNGCSYTSQMLLFIFLKTNKVFFLPWKWDGRTRVSRTGPTGSKCWAGPFPQGARQTRTSSLTVCLCGSSKTSCWRKSPFTWLVWSELEGFLPAGLQVALLRTKIQRLGVASSQELQLHNCLKQLWNENSTPEANLIVWIGMSIQVLVIQSWVSADSWESSYFPTQQSHKH